MSRVPDLSVKIAGIVFPNPVILASGTVGYGEEFEGLIDLSRVGGIAVKGTSLEPIEGNPSPRLFPTPSGMLNSIGLQNVGVDRFIKDKMPFLRKSGCQVLVNVFGFTLDDYVGVVERLNDCDGIAAYELNISCPNTERGGMVFGTRADATRELVDRVKARSLRPLVVKLSPNVTDIATVAHAAEDAGADALTVANTYLAMAIDPETYRPRIQNVTAGLSGPAIRPITLRMVYECAARVKIPIFGLGGIDSGNDAVEYFLAGASAVQVGTANFKDPGSSVRIIQEIEHFLKRKNIASVTDLVGRIDTAQSASDEH
jgi:dihydroorotate dehydrogenase (NAD+) catalytic subunit